MISTVRFLMVRSRILGQLLFSNELGSGALSASSDNIRRLALPTEPARNQSLQADRYRSLLVSVGRRRSDGIVANPDAYELCCAPFCTCGSRPSQHDRDDRAGRIRYFESLLSGRFVGATVQQ